MYIKKIEIDSFGCIKNYSISLSKGFNLIYGANESGKTTLFSFILYIFYGTKIKKIPGDLSFKDKYMPWDGSSMQGRITFEYDGMEYILSRLCSKHNSDISLFCTDTSEEIKDRQVLACPGEHFFKIGAEELYRSTYITSMQSEYNSMSADRLISELANIYQTDSIKVSYTHVSDIIKERISTLVSAKKRNPVIPNIEKQIFELKSKLSAHEREIEEAKQLDEEKQILEEEIDNISRQISELKENTDVPKEQKAPVAFAIISAVFIAVSSLLIIFGKTIIGIISLVLSLVFVFVYYRISVRLQKDYERKLFTLRANNDKIMSLTENAYSLKEKYSLYTERQRLINIKESTGAEYSCKLSELNNQLSQYKLQLESLNLAKNALDSGFEELSSMFAPQLSSLTGKHLSEITGGTYSKALVNDSLDINIESTSGYKNALCFSQGGKEQAYLAMRLALSEVLSDGIYLPLFLDDALAFYDKKRSEATLRLLLEISKEKQILFSTCREAEYEFIKNLLTERKDLYVNEFRI